MSIANLNNYRDLRVANAAESKLATTKTSVTSVPAETEARGFALYIGLDEKTAAAAGTTLTEVVAALKKTLGELVPAAAQETYAAVALAPVGIGGRNVEVVRTALRDPRAIDKRQSEDRPALGIVVDVTRKKVFIDGRNAEFTYKEFELLNYLVDNEGETVSRRELVEAVWVDDEENAPNDRTIDVHVRRLRAKISGYEDIIRTIRGGGYRFDKHPDVLIEA